MLTVKTLKNQLFFKFVVFAFLPAVVLFFTKILSMLLFAGYYNISYLKTENGVVFANFQNFIFVNDLSNLITYTVMASFTIWMLIKAYFFHASHISPKFSSWLNVQNLEHLVMGSINLYLKSISWVVFTWFTTFMVLGHAIIGVGSFSVFYLTSAVSVALTVLLIVDIEKDHSIIKELKKLEI
jgi:hypothetical protein